MRRWLIRASFSAAVLGVFASHAARASRVRPAPMRLWPGAAPGALGPGLRRCPHHLALPAQCVPRRPVPPLSSAPVDRTPCSPITKGHAIAVWLNSIGVTAVVLKYRLGPRYHHPVELQDVARAMRTVRARAAEWGIDPHRIGVMGFSAGGHLASTIATHFDAGDSTSADPIERMSSRPDIAVLAYPVISMRDGVTHQGSRRNLLGDNPTQELKAELSNEEHVTAQTPPTFLFHTADDPVVPVQNSLLFAAALGCREGSVRAARVRAGAAWRGTRAERSGAQCVAEPAPALAPGAGVHSSKWCGARLSVAIGEPGSYRYAGRTVCYRRHPARASYRPAHPSIGEMNATPDPGSQSLSPRGVRQEGSARSAAARATRGAASSRPDLPRRRGRDVELQDDARRQRQRAGYLYGGCHGGHVGLDPDLSEAANR